MARSKLTDEKLSVVSEALAETGGRVRAAVRLLKSRGVAVGYGTVQLVAKGLRGRSCSGSESLMGESVVKDFRRDTGTVVTKSLDIRTLDQALAAAEVDRAVWDVDRYVVNSWEVTLGAAGTYNSEKEGAEGRFVVVGSSGWAANNTLRFNGNRDLFVNMMNWLSSDEDLISIRPKEPDDRRLTLTRAQMSSVFYSSVVGLPLIVVIFGLSVWWRRR